MLNHGLWKLGGYSSNSHVIWYFFMVASQFSTIVWGLLIQGWHYLKFCVFHYLKPCCQVLKFCVFHDISWSEILAEKTRRLPVDPKYPNWRSQNPNRGQLLCSKTTNYCLRAIPTNWDSIWHIFWHYIWHSVWHIISHSIGHSFWHIFWHSISHSIWHSICHLFWHSIWHAVWHSIWHSSWYFMWHLALATNPAVPTDIWLSQLGSGSAQWDLALAEEKKEKEKKEAEATLIKSRDPHLAGGEVHP